MPPAPANTRYIFLLPRVDEVPGTIAACRHTVGHCLPSVRRGEMGDPLDEVAGAIGCHGEGSCVDNLCLHSAFELGPADLSTLPGMSGAANRPPGGSDAVATAHRSGGDASGSSDGGDRSVRHGQLSAAAAGNRSHPFHGASVLDDFSKSIGAGQVRHSGSAARRQREELETMAASLNSLAALAPQEMQSPALHLLTGGGAIRKDLKPKHLCQDCGKVFKRAHNLKIHGRLHTGDRPYGCPFAHCEKEFRWKSSIVSHLNWHRTKMGELLPGFDGAIGAGDLRAGRPGDAVVSPKALHDGLNLQGHTGDGLRLSAVPKLEEALFLQSQAQARQDAALKAADEAIAATSRATVLANAVAHAESVRTASAWPVPDALKGLTSPTSQQTSPPSLSSESEATEYLSAPIAPTTATAPALPSPPQPSSASRTLAATRGRELPNDILRDARMSAPHYSEECDPGGSRVAVASAKIGGDVADTSTMFDFFE
jgi:hypothetical protein